MARSRARSSSLEKPPTAQEVVKQANQARLDRLKQSLSSNKANALIENASYLGRKWLSILPTYKQAILTDQEITEALRIRLIVTSRVDDPNPFSPISSPRPDQPASPRARPNPSLCSFCGAIPSTIGHADTCKAAARGWINRHNAITRAFKNTLSSRVALAVESEPLISADSSLRADLAVTLGNSRYYYDIQIVAIAKDSKKGDPYSTLGEAAEAKRRKYRSLGAYFNPVIISAGGLMEKETAKTYKSLQRVLGLTASSYLDTTISIALLRARATAAASIANPSLIAREASR